MFEAAREGLPGARDPLGRRLRAKAIEAYAGSACRIVASKPGNIPTSARFSVKSIP